MAATMATLREPYRLEINGIAGENNNIPTGIIAELAPIISVDTPRDCKMSESNGAVMPNASPKTVIAEQAAIRFLTFACVGTLSMGLACRWLLGITKVDAGTYTRTAAAATVILPGSRWLLIG